MFGISYWVLPLFAACVWFATLMAMLITWITQGSPIYASMEPGQHIAYISDIGAQGLKPLFIAGSTVCVVVFDLTFISERWLRHKGRLAHNTSRTQKALSICAVIASIAGAAGLILLSIFDTLRHPQMHDIFLCIFIGGYIISAIFICAEYQRLGIHFRQYRHLRTSFWLKLAFIFVELALAISFGVLNVKNHANRAAILEWVVSLVYIFYVASFILDFLPAVHSKHDHFPSVTERSQLEHGGDTEGPSVSGGPVYLESYHHNNTSYASTRPMQEQGRYYPAAEPLPQQIAPSRNF